MPKSGMLVVSGSGMVARVSVRISGWKLSLYVAPRYRYISFIVQNNLSDAIGTRSKIYPFKSVYRPLKQVSDLGSGTVMFLRLLPLYLLGLEALTLFPSV